MTSAKSTSVPLSTSYKRSSPSRCFVLSSKWWELWSAAVCQVVVRWLTAGRLAVRSVLITSRCWYCSGRTLSWWRVVELVCRSWWMSRWKVVQPSDVSCCAMKCINFVSSFSRYSATSTGAANAIVAAAATLRQSLRFYHLHEWCLPEESVNILASSDPFGYLL